MIRITFVYFSDKVEQYLFVTKYSQSNLCASRIYCPTFPKANCCTYGEACLLLYAKDG